MSMQAAYRRSDERHGRIRAAESLEQLDRVHDTGLAIVVDEELRSGHRSEKAVH